MVCVNFKDEFVQNCHVHTILTTQEHGKYSICSSSFISVFHDFLHAGPELSLLGF